MNEVQSYAIQYNNETEHFVMEGVSVPLIGDHLKFINVKEKAYMSASSESHLLYQLRDLGIKIELLEEDGSEMSW